MTDFSTVAIRARLMLTPDQRHTAGVPLTPHDISHLLDDREALAAALEDFLQDYVQPDENISLDLRVHAEAFRAALALHRGDGA